MVGCYGLLFKPIHTHPPTMPLSLTYPLTDSLTAYLDRLANFTRLSRETSVFFAVVVVGMIADYAQRANDGDLLAKMQIVVVTKLGETELDGMLANPLPIERIAARRIRISFPPMAHDHNPSNTITAMAEWFGCAPNDAITCAVFWIFEALSMVSDGGSIVMRCVLGTEFTIYSCVQHEQIMGRVGAMWREWEEKGGYVREEWRWDGMR